jgi:hypothetical protein
VRRRKSHNPYLTNLIGELPPQCVGRERGQAPSPDGVIFISFAFVEAAANPLTNPKLDPFGKIPACVAITCGLPAMYRSMSHFNSPSGYRAVHSLPVWREFNR